jgi:hypothetical protein
VPTSTVMRGLAFGFVGFIWSPARKMLPTTEGELSGISQRHTEAVVGRVGLEPTAKGL